MPDLADALQSECEQIPASVFQHLVEGLPRRTRAFKAANGGINAFCHAFEIKRSKTQECQRGQALVFGVRICLVVPVFPKGIE